MALIGEPSSPLCSVASEEAAEFHLKKKTVFPNGVTAMSTSVWRLPVLLRPPDQLVHKPGQFPSTGHQQFNWVSEMLLLNQKW